MINITSPVTGQPITGLTTPTYTVVTDIAPSMYGKQVAITALGGTQVGVTAHSASSPFTGTFSRPAVLKTITYNSNGTVKSVPLNNYRLLIRKGVTVQTGLTKPMSISIAVDLPANAEVLDAANISAAFSLAAGLFIQQFQNLRDTAATGLL